MKKRLLYLVLTAFMALTAVFNASAQVNNPAPFDLSTGDYSFTQWDPASPATTYPANMRFYKGYIGDPQDTSLFMLDYIDLYNKTSGTRITGLGTSGFYFTNTSGGTNGAAVVALNTMGRTAINVSYLVGVQTQNQKIYAIKLEYKIGDAGTYTSLYDAQGNVIEFVANADSTYGKTNYTQTYNINLPSSVENKPLVYLRWKYYYKVASAVTVTGGARPALRLDDITVTSQSVVGTPTKLQCTTVNPPTPMMNMPFSFTVKFVDAGGVGKIPAPGTQITLTPNTGVLTGTTTKTVAPGAWDITFDNLFFNTLGNATITATSTGLTPDSKVVTFVNGPRSILIDSFATKVNVGLNLNKFYFKVLDDNGQVFPAYTGFNVNVAATGIAGTTTKTINNGVIDFTDVNFTVPGDYVVTFSAPGLVPVTKNLKVYPALKVSELMIPRYISSNYGPIDTTKNGKRLISYALVKVENLLPGTKYRFLSGGTNNPNYDSDPYNQLWFTTPGNNIHRNYDNGTYWFNSVKDITKPDSYSSFTTGANETTRTFWITLAPSDNVVFKTNDIADMKLYWLFNLADDNGVTIKRYQAVQPSVLLDFGGKPYNGTGIYDPNSKLTPKTYLALYDDQNTPVSIAYVQDEGVLYKKGTQAHQSPAWFENQVDAVNGAWGTILPNAQATGVRKIVQYAEDGSVIKTWTDADGVWANVSTSNLFGGDSIPVVFGTPRIDLINPVQGEEFCNSSKYRLTWDARGVSNFDLEVSTNGTGFESALIKVDASKGYYDWEAPRHVFSNTPITIRIKSSEHPYVFDDNKLITIWDAPIIKNQSPSRVYCKGNNISLFVVADGSEPTYQWYKDGFKIEGATSYNLLMNNVDFNVSGNYTCAVNGKNSCPSTINVPIVVYVAQSAEVTKQPVVQMSEIGGSATFYAEANLNGKHPGYTMTAQWYRNDTALVDNDRIKGARSNYLTINKIKASDFNDNYYCAFTGLCPETDTKSNKVALKLLEMNITDQPQDNMICEDSPVNLTVGATATGETLTYQWYKDGVALTENSNVTGVKTASLDIAKVTPALAGEYKATVTGSISGKVLTTNIAKVSVLLKPTVTVQPVSKISAQTGKSFTINVKVSGTGPFAYQWIKDGSDVSGATDTLYTVASAASRDAGVYKVKVIGACGDVTSDSCVVTVAKQEATGVNEEFAGKLAIVSVTPNPVSDFAKIEYNMNQDAYAKIVLRNEIGAEVAVLFQGNARLGLNTLEIKRSDLPLASGTYFVELVSEGLVSYRAINIVK